MRHAGPAARSKHLVDGDRLHLMQVTGVHTGKGKDLSQEGEQV